MPEQGAAPMSPGEVRWRLLVSAAEDYEPLFQALWEFGLPGSPQPGGPTVDQVKGTLWQLITEGLVALFRGLDARDNYVLVPPEWTASVFADPASWAEIEDPAAGVRYSTTPAGDTAVRVRPANVPEPDWRGGPRD